MTELMNKIICNILTHYVKNNQNTSVFYYKLVVFAYNTYPHSRLEYSPYFLMFGTEATQPQDNKIFPTETDFDRFENITQLQKIRELIPKMIKTEQDKHKSHSDTTH